MKYIHYLIFSFLFLAACTDHAEVVTVGVQKDTTVVWIDSLQKIDKNLLLDEELNPEKGWKAFQAFRKFARTNPDHPLAPTYHMKAAAIARNIPGKALMAIEEYMTVYQTYPQDSLAPQAQFLVGFTFDQALNDKERSAKAYNGFIEAYPEHPLAMQARELLAMSTNTDDDLEQVKKWKKATKK